MSNSKKLTILFVTFLVFVFGLFLLFKFLTSGRVDPELIAALSSYEDEGLYGIKNSETGDIVIKAIYEKIGKITTDNVIVVKKDDKYGCINYKGEVVIPIEYQELGDISDGLLLAKYEDKYGYLNKKGETAISFEYDEATDFSNKVARVKAGNVEGYIVTSGTALFDGIAYSEIDDEDKEFVILKRENDAKYGVVDLTTGKNVTDFDYKSFDRIDGTSDYFSCSKPDEENNNQIKYALLYKDSKNEIYKILNFEYEFIDDVLYSGRIVIKQNGKYFFTDLSGHTNEDSISLDDIQLIEGGTEYFAKKNNKYGIVYFNGDKLVQPTGFAYERIESLSPTRSICMINGIWFAIENKTGFIIDNTTGKPITDNQFEPDTENTYNTISKIDKERNIVRRENKVGMISSTGKLVIDIIYNSIDVKEDFIKVNKEGLYGFFDLDAKLLTECIYDSMDNEFHFDRLRVSRDKLYGFLDKNGKEVIEPQYITAEVFSKNKAGEIVAEVSKEDKKYFNIDVNGDKA